MASLLTELELCAIDGMTRQELIAGVRARRDDLPLDLLAHLEEQPIERLQLLLLAGRLTGVLRQLRTEATARRSRESLQPTGTA
jgi:hypothetical protein